VISRPHVHGLVLPSKPPAQTPKFKTLQKLILSFFHNVMHLLSQLTDNGMIVLSVAESVKLVPYVASSRKTLKLYTKVRIAPLAACSCRDRFRM
jgi:nucleolar complex protein 2